MAKRDNRWCLICQPRNRTLYWHLKEDGSIFCWCNKCDRAYSLTQYCEIAGIDKEQFIDGGDFVIQEAQPNEVNAMAWPAKFIPLSDPRSVKGVEYIKSRGLNIEGDMYYDLEEEGIVFPYYFENQFCGAQVRFIKERINEDGDKWKITTLPGTRLGLLFYGWNQAKLMAQIKGIIVCEGAFNAISIQQAFNKRYGGLSRCPWRVIACSGSGATEFQTETLKELREQGYKIIIAADTDEAGIKMFNKYREAGAATHYAFTNDTTKDWNVLLKELGHDEFATFVLKSITAVDVN